MHGNMPTNIIHRDKGLTGRPLRKSEPNDEKIIFGKYHDVFVSFCKA